MAFLWLYIQQFRNNDVKINFFFLLNKLLSLYDENYFYKHST